MVKIIIPLLLLLIYCVDNLCPAVILPLFPKIAETLHVTRVELHECIGFITAGIFFSQLLIGINVEKIGYRNVFYLLFVMLCVGAVIALNATSIYIFFLGEFIQGFGIGAAVPVICGLVNIFEKKKADKIFSYVGSFPVFILFFAPLVGDQFHDSWNHVFYTILISGFILLLLSSFIPQHSAIVEKNKTSTLQSVRRLIKNKHYLIYVSVRVLLNLGFYIFLAWVPFIIIVDLHIPHHQFSYLMIFPTLGLFIGGITSHFFARQIKYAIYVGGTILCIAGLLLLSFYYSDIFTIWSILFAGSLFYLGIGMMIPPSFLGMFSAIDDELSDIAVVLCSIMVNLSASIIIILLAHIKVDDKLLLGIAFAILGVAIISVMKIKQISHTK